MINSYYYNYVSCYDAYIQNNNIWGICNKHQCLFKYNLISKKIEQYQALPLFQNPNSCIYKKIFQQDNLLFFIPLIGNNILTYNMNTKQFSTFFSNKEKRLLNLNKISTADTIFYKNNLYIIPLYINTPFLIIDINTKQTTILHNWTNIVTETIPDKLYKSTTSVLYNDSIYTPLCNTNKIIELNLITNALTVHTLSLNNNTIFTLGCAENLIITTNESDSVFSWNPTENKCIEYTRYDKERKITEPLYYRIIYHNHLTLIFPYKYGDILFIDPETKTINKFTDYPNNFSFDYNEGASFYGYTCIQDKIYLFPLRSNSLIIIDCPNRSISRTSIKFNEYDKLNHFATPKIYNEQTPYALRNLLALNTNTRNISFDTFTNGKNIYNNMHY